MNQGFATLQTFLRESSGFVLGDDKGYLLEDRLEPILRSERLSGLDELARRLLVDSRSELAKTVVEALTINETSFFRDRALFDVFNSTLLPNLLAARQSTKRLRIWCAACSTGQEPYTLAMILDDHARKLTGWRIEVVATDLSSRVIDIAKLGVYSQFEVQRGLPVAMLLRHFRREEDKWQISDHLRAKVSFKTHNLMSSADALGRFDIIFCRNVLLYFDATGKRRVLTNLANALADDGYLALGGTETVHELSDRLRPRGAHFVFGKTDAAAGPQRTQA